MNGNATPEAVNNFKDVIHDSVCVCMCEREREKERETLSLCNQKQITSSRINEGWVLDICRLNKKKYYLSLASQRPQLSWVIFFFFILSEIRITYTNSTIQLTLQDSSPINMIQPHPLHWSNFLNIIVSHQF